MIARLWRFPFRSELIAAVLLFGFGLVYVGVSPQATFFGFMPFFIACTISAAASWTTWSWKAGLVLCLWLAVRLRAPTSIWFVLPLLGLEILRECTPPWQGVAGLMFLSKDGWKFTAKRYHRRMPGCSWCGSPDHMEWGDCLIAIDMGGPDSPSYRRRFKYEVFHCRNCCLVFASPWYTDKKMSGRD